MLASLRRAATGLAPPAIEPRIVAITLTSVVIVYLVLGPLLMLVFSTFRGTIGRLPFDPNAPWTLDNYVRVFFDPATYQVLVNTFLFAAGSLSLSFAISVALAWLVERTDVPFKGTVYALTTASLGVPLIIFAIAWTLLLNPSNGFVNVVLQDLFGLSGDGPLNVYSLAGLIFVQSVGLVPLTFLFITASFRSMDAALEEAARTSGARHGAVVRRVTIPLMAPALLSALVYQFVTVVESFDIPLIIGLRGDISVLSTKIFSEIRPPGGLPDLGLASTYGILLLLLSVGPLVLYNRMISRSERFAVVSGHSYRPRQVELGLWKYPAVALVATFMLVGFLLPALVMIWTSIQPFYSLPSPESLARITFDEYLALLSSASVREVFINTALLGAATASGAMVLGLLAGWIIVRTRTAARGLLDVVAFLPHAFPGVIIGLSIILIYLTLPVPIYGTLWIIVIALTTQELSLATRLMSAAIVQVNRQLEEAAETSGATWRQTITRVLFPLVTPSFVNGWLLVFLGSIKNLTLALLLFSSDSQVLSTLIWVRWDAGDTAGTAALSVLMLVVTIALAIPLRHMSVRHSSKL